MCSSDLWKPKADASCCNLGLPSGRTCVGNLSRFSTGHHGHAYQCTSGSSRCPTADRPPRGPAAAADPPALFWAGVTHIESALHRRDRDPSGGRFATNPAGHFRRISSGMSNRSAQSRLICTESRPQALTASKRASRVPLLNVPSRMPVWIAAGALDSPAANSLRGPVTPTARAAAWVSW